MNNINEQKLAHVLLHFSNALSAMSYQIHEACDSPFTQHLIVAEHLKKANEAIGELFLNVGSENDGKSLQGE